MGEAAPHLHPVPDHETEESGLMLTPVPVPVSAPATPLVTTSPQTTRGTSGFRVDMKWLCGIPFTFFLIIGLVVLAVFLATGREQAISTIDAMNQQLVTEIKLLPGLGLGGQQLQEFLNQPGFAETVYDDPASLEAVVATFQDSSPALEEDPAAGIKSMLSGYASTARFLSAGSHEKLGAGITILGVMLLITGIPFILLSRRAGKVLSPAISLAVASWPVLLMLSWMHDGVIARIDSFKSEATSRPEQVLADTIRPFTDGLFNPAMSTYRTFAYASAAMMGVAAAIFGIARWRERA